MDNYYLKLEEFDSIYYKNYDTELYQYENEILDLFNGKIRIEDFKLNDLKYHYQILGDYTRYYKRDNEEAQKYYKLASEHDNNVCKINLILINFKKNESNYYQEFIKELLYNNYVIYYLVNILDTSLDILDKIVFKTFKIIFKSYENLNLSNNLNLSYNLNQSNNNYFNKIYNLYNYIFNNDINKNNNISTNTIKLLINIFKLNEFEINYKVLDELCKEHKYFLFYYLKYLFTNNLLTNNLLNNIFVNENKNKNKNNNKLIIQNNFKILYNYLKCSVYKGEDNFLVLDINYDIKENLKKNIKINKKIITLANEQQQQNFQNYNNYTINILLNNYKYFTNNTNNKHVHKTCIINQIFELYLLKSSSKITNILTIKYFIESLNYMNTININNLQKFYKKVNNNSDILNNIFESYFHLIKLNFNYFNYIKFDTLYYMAFTNYNKYILDESYSNGSKKILDCYKNNIIHNYKFVKFYYEKIKFAKYLKKYFDDLYYFNDLDDSDDSYISNIVNNSNNLENNLENILENNLEKNSNDIFNNNELNEKPRNIYGHIIHDIDIEISNNILKHFNNKEIIKNYKLNLNYLDYYILDITNLYNFENYYINYKHIFKTNYENVNIMNIKFIQYNPDSDNNNDNKCKIDSNCIICLEKKHTFIQFNNCKHQVCNSCYFKLIETCNTCPYCRTKL
jgi:hypothetical protein